MSGWEWDSDLVKTELDIGIPVRVGLAGTCPMT